MNTQELLLPQELFLVGNVVTNIYKHRCGERHVFVRSSIQKYGNMQQIYLRKEKWVLNCRWIYVMRLVVIVNFGLP